MIFSHDKKDSIKGISLILLLSLFSLAMYAQQHLPILSIRLKNASLKELTTQIEKATEYSFIYGEEVTLKHPITLHLKKVPLDVILQKAFDGQDITFEWMNKHIILRKKKRHPRTRWVTINGYVVDAVSKETLIGANIYEPQAQKGTTTNPFGYFSLTLPAENTTLNFSYIGYVTQKIPLSLCQDTLLTVRMQSNTALKEIVVLSDKSETGIHSSRMGASSLPLVQLQHAPALLGEADVLKSIQLMPGVQAGMMGTSGLHVRGGGQDQNLYLLDGVPLYNVDHTLGLMSVFGPEAVKKVDIYKSSFPARFGGRLSSIVDVRTNDGDMQHYHGSFSIGLLTSHLHFEGPIWKNRTSFIVSARRSYIDLFLPLLMSKRERGGYSLYDINAKLNHRFSERDRVFLSFYKGNDHIYYRYKDEDQIKQTHDWGNVLINARWNHTFTPKLFSNTTVAYSRYKFNIDQNEHSTSYPEEDNTTTIGYANNFHSGIDDLCVGTDFDFHPIPTHSIKFGGKYIYHAFTPTVQNSRSFGYDSTGGTGNTYYHPNPHVYAHDFSFYAEDDFNLGQRWKFNTGLHLSLFTVQKHPYVFLQPRLSASYMLTDDLILKGAFTQMNQHTQLLSMSSVDMPSDLWVPVTKQIRPMKSFQYSAGLYYTGIRQWEFSMEGYYKDMHNVLEYKDGDSFLGSSVNWEEKVEMGKGRSFGIELMAEKTAGRLTGWINYTLSKSDRKFATNGINNGKRFPYQYDRRHVVNLTLNYQLTKRIDFNLSWFYQSGCLTTLPKEKTHINIPPMNTPFYWSDHPQSQSIDYYNTRNNYRLPPTHQLNLGFNFRKKTKHGERIWNISIMNVYCAMNPNFVYIVREKGTQRPVLKKMTLIPFLPSFSYTYKF